MMVPRWRPVSGCGRMPLREVFLAGLGGSSGSVIRVIFPFPRVRGVISTDGIEGGLRQWHFCWVTLTPYLSGTCVESLGCWCFLSPVGAVGISI